MMRSFGYKALAISALTLGLTVGCAEGTRTAEDTTADVGAEARQMRAEARRAMQDQIREADATIAQLKREAAEAGREMEQSWDETIADLERKTAELKRELEGTEGDSEDAWDDFSRRARAAMQEIQTGIREAADELRG